MVNLTYMKHYLSQWDGVDKRDCVSQQDLAFCVAAEAADVVPALIRENEELRATTQAVRDELAQFPTVAALEPLRMLERWL